VIVAIGFATGLESVGRIVFVISVTTLRGVIVFVSVFSVRIGPGVFMF